MSPAWLCVVALLLGQAAGQQWCVRPLVTYSEDRTGNVKGFFKISNPFPFYSIVVKTYTEGWDKGGFGHSGNVRLFKDTSNILEFLVDLPSQNPTSHIVEIRCNAVLICRTPVPFGASTSILTASGLREGPVHYGEDGHQTYPYDSFEPDSDFHNLSPDSFEAAESNNVHNYIPSMWPRLQTPGYRPEPPTPPPTSTPPFYIRLRTTKIPRPNIRPSAATNYNQAECGMASTPSPNILGGMETTRGDWPWLAALVAKDTRKLFCGSTIISKWYVITAAHCMFHTQTRKQKNSNSVLVVAGAFNVSDTDEKETQYRKIRRAILHPEYNHDSKQNDIALLLLEQELEYTTYILPICMWPPEVQEFNMTGMKGNVVGWGLTEHSRVKNSDVPLIARVPIVSSDTCLGSHNSIKFYFNRDTEFCAGAKVGDFGNVTGPCMGDSGSALAIQLRTPNRHTQWFLRGIVSYSPPGIEDLCNLDNYSVYTDTAKFAMWVMEMVHNSLSSTQYD